MRVELKSIDLGAYLGNITEELLEQTTTILKRDIYDKLSEPYPPASQRGEAPHYRTSALRNSIIQRKLSKNKREVGPSMDYAMDLIEELDRPYLRLVAALVPTE